MDSLWASATTDSGGVPDARTRKPFVFNVSGLQGAERWAVVEAILDHYPPLVRHVRTVTAGGSPAEIDEPDPDRGVGRWVRCGPVDEEAALVTSVDEIERNGRNGWVCVQDTYPSAEGAGEMRRLFGSRVFSVALLAEEGSSPSAPHAARYMLENPSVATSEGQMRVFDLHLGGADRGTTLAEVLRLFETKFLEY